MTFDSGLAARWSDESLAFEYGVGVVGPKPEHRRLDAIRASLCDPDCHGPDPVYSIAMNVGRREHLPELQRRKLLFGVVAYAAGRLGREPVRSQGHVHAISLHSGWSPPELFEIWEGRAVVYAQQYLGDEPGICVAVEAGPGDQVVVPPGWAHCVMNLDESSHMVFAACCDRDYGFVYDDVRARGGLAWYAIMGNHNEIAWEPNPRYHVAELRQREARSYSELGLSRSIPIYEQFARDPVSVQWVSNPALVASLWPSFQP
jgi:glucose-6-phosphate isomerase